MFNPCYIGTYLYSWYKGKKVGQDEFGNDYFVEHPKPKNKKQKRWVLYNGLKEASKVPPKWHSWLHYNTDAPIEDCHYKWLKQHKPNLSGTKNEYMPNKNM